MRISLLRASRFGLATLILLTLTGCETLLASRSHAKHPVQGQLVDIGGRKLQIDCRGHGSPTVILESGGDMFGSLSWSMVQNDIAAITRVCSYSRAAIMWSDARADQLDRDGTAHDLHRLLAAANEHPPYVLVGHSRGGLYNLIYTGLYADEVSGLVFVDASHPAQVARYAQQGLDIDDHLQASVRIALALRWSGIPRLVSRRFTEPSAPAEINEAFQTYFPQSLSGYASEKSVLTSTSLRADGFRALHDRPVIVLTRQLPMSQNTDDAEASARTRKWEAIWGELQLEMSTWSSQGEHRFVPDSNHGLQLSQPQAVIRAVADVVEKTRTNSQAKNR